MAAADKAGQQYLESKKLPQTKGGSLKMTHKRVQEVVTTSAIWPLLKKYDAKPGGHLVAQLVVERAFHFDFVEDYNIHGTAARFDLRKSTYFRIKDVPGLQCSEEMRTILFHPASRHFLRGLVKAVRPNSVRKWSLFYNLSVTYFKSVISTWNVADLLAEIHRTFPRSLRKVSR